VGGERALALARRLIKSEVVDFIVIIGNRGVVVVWGAFDGRT